MTPLAPFFLGAYGENNDFFEKTLLELVRDHVFWRRNFHPEDEPPIGTHDQYSRAYLDGLATTRHELHQLTAALKRSVPSFHPRYLGHMVSDLLLPGLIAQLVTTLYNPNNIVEDVAPITIQLELEVGRQLARMLGLTSTRSKGPAHWAPHLGRHGGQRRGAVARTVGTTLPARPPRCVRRDRHSGSRIFRCGRAVPTQSCSRLARTQVLALARRVVRFCAREPRGGQLFEALDAARVEETGLAAFTERHPSVRRMAVVLPATGHYSWHKAMSLLGLGGST